jgi:hypothetical protein
MRNKEHLRAADLTTLTERALYEKVFPPHKERGPARLPDPETPNPAQLLFG